MIEATRMEDHIWVAIRDRRTPEQRKADGFIDGPKRHVLERIEDTTQDLHMMGGYLIDLRRIAGLPGRTRCPCCWKGTLEAWAERRPDVE